MSLNDEGVVMHARTQTPHPTQPSARMTGWPSSSMVSAAVPTGQALAQTPQELPLEGDAALRQQLERAQDDTQPIPPTGG